MHRNPGSTTTTVFPLRLPSNEMRDALKKRASENRLSVNSLLLNIIEDYLRRQTCQEFDDSPLEI